MEDIMEMRQNYLRNIRVKLKREGLRQESACLIWNEYYHKQPSYKFVTIGYYEMMRQKDAKVYQQCIEHIDDLIKEHT